MDKTSFTETCFDQQECRLSLLTSVSTVSMFGVLPPGVRISESFSDFTSSTLLQPPPVSCWPASLGTIAATVINNYKDPTRHDQSEVLRTNRSYCVLPVPYFLLLFIEGFYSIVSPKYLVLTAPVSGLGAPCWSGVAEPGAPAWRC